MKIGAVRLLPSHTGKGIAFAYGYGALLGALTLAWFWMTRRDIPQLTWWQYLLAPLAIGLGALMLEALGMFLSNGFSMKPVNSAPRRTAGNVALVVAVLLLVLGWPIYQMSQP